MQVYLSIYVDMDNIFQDSLVNAEYDLSIIQPVLTSV